MGNSNTSDTQEDEKTIKISIEFKNIIHDRLYHENKISIIKNEKGQIRTAVDIISYKKVYVREHNVIEKTTCDTIYDDDIANEICNQNSECADFMKKCEDLYKKQTKK